ncbi:hypothetical protein D9757_008152 [Collybiopsis confluens]|uniref:DUF6534 domain-containing protein n=1 Tax=Collybiopsis confluens TaxID=2823264 RepID=A0A8H5HDY3_9AGAR|nr:hypothetical protein D9757_008152 [Collybiopsis confluens]
MNLHIGSAFTSTSNDNPGPSSSQLPSQSDDIFTRIIAVTPYHQSPLQTLTSLEHVPVQVTRQNKYLDSLEKELKNAERRAEQLSEKTKEERKINEDFGRSTARKLTAMLKGKSGVEKFEAKKAQHDRTQLILDCHLQRASLFEQAESNITTALRKVEKALKFSGFSGSDSWSREVKNRDALADAAENTESAKKSVDEARRLLSEVRNGGSSSASSYGMIQPNMYLGTRPPSHNVPRGGGGGWSWARVLTFMITSTEFSLLASGWGNRAALEHLGTGWFDIPIMSSIPSTVVQCFYAWRLYALSASVPLFGLIVVLALTECAGALALGIFINTSLHSLAELQSNRHAVITSIIWLVGSAACDLVICVSTLGLLSRAPKTVENNETRSTINRILILTVGGGVVTASVAIVDVILYLAYPHNNVHFAAAFVLPKLYTNALMVILNNRIRNLDDNSACVAGGFSSHGSIGTMFL